MTHCVKTARYSVLMQRGHHYQHPAHTGTQPPHGPVRCNPQHGGVCPPSSNREEQSFSFSALTPQCGCSTTSPCLLGCQGPTPSASSLSSSAENKPGLLIAQGTWEKNIYLEIKQEGDTPLPPQTNHPSNSWKGVFLAVSQRAFHWVHSSLTQKLVYLSRCFQSQEDISKTFPDTKMTLPD